jgi:hypothetical protein
VVNVFRPSFNQQPVRRYYSKRAPITSGDLRLRNFLPILHNDPAGGKMQAPRVALAARRSLDMAVSVTTADLGRTGGP